MENSTEPLKKVKDLVFITPRIIELMTAHNWGLISDEVYAAKLREFQKLI